MNSTPNSESDAIRSDIETTRRRMDDTMDALGERLHGRHLLDEIIGFFRHDEPSNGTASRVREEVSEAAGRAKDKMSEVAGTATRAVVDTVKRNPIPVALIGAGAAWLAISALRNRRSPDRDEADEEASYDPDLHYDRPIEYPGGGPESMPATAETDEAALEGLTDIYGDQGDQPTDQPRGKLSELSERAKEKLQAARERAGEFADETAERTRAAYGRTRDRIAQTVDEHPIEVGLGCLVAGLLVGLALPTPKPVHRIAGPAVDRLRNRTRETGKEFIQKGRRVVQAAAGAAKQEAQTQGLTWEQLHGSGRAEANPADTAAASEAARPPTDAQDNARAGTGPADPSAGGPAM